MAVVIDGYNMLYAIGRLTPRTPRDGLDGARHWLLDELRSRHGPAEDLTVVFDGGSAPGGRSRDDRLGIRVVFSQGESADDVIEDIIRATPSPVTLTVVSDDHRLLQAARKRGCEAVGCLDYFDADRTTPRAVTAEPPSKPESSSPEDVEHYLRAFGDLDDDPLLRDPF